MTPTGSTSANNTSRTITKKELVDRIADATGQKRADVKRTLQDLLDHIIDELGKGNRIEFRDFGVFETKVRAPRVAQNPKTLERVDVPSKRTVKFKVGRLMRERMDEPVTDAVRDHPPEPQPAAQAADLELKPTQPADPVPHRHARPPRTDARTETRIETAERTTLQTES